MIALIDTDVLVDCLRGSQAAKTWLQSASRDPFQVPGIAAMKLVIGYRNAGDLKTVLLFLGRFDVVWPEVTEFARAFELLAALRLKSGLSIPECLTALTRSAKLLTFNARHYAAVKGLVVEEPYSRK